ncbi:MAG: hypothetical protein Q8M24_08385 [Pseudolabrys sp.]|nr:hypothetical protein [Pseudolabrys sp.]MDP2295464.1 hypothetical protein [Pseudolabrys sp.]
MKKPKQTPAPADDETASFIASVAMPMPPYITRADDKLGTVSITDTGLEFIKRRASDGASQNLIAAEMGLTKATLQKLFQRDERCRVAWEHGAALEEMELVDILKQAARKGYAVAALFLLKTRHGYTETAAPPTTAPNITIVLPDSYTPEQYMRVINERPKVTRPVALAPLSGTGGTTR